MFYLRKTASSFALMAMGALAPVATGCAAADAASESAANDLSGSGTQGIVCSGGTGSYSIAYRDPKTGELFRGSVSSSHDCTDDNVRYHGLEVSFFSGKTEYILKATSKPARATPKRVDAALDAALALRSDCVPWREIAFARQNALPLLELGKTAEATAVWERYLRSDEAAKAWKADARCVEASKL
jgi:hypothetical protein